MKINAFKVNQYSENGKQFKIFVSSISIFDLKDYVYVKTVKDYLLQTDEEKVLNNIFGKNGTEQYMNIESIQIDSEGKTKKVKETQRELNEKKLKSISNYIKQEKGVFPTSILLGSKIEDFIKVDENNGINILEINDIYKGKEGFFIIDGQHRVFGILNYIYEKLLINFNKEKSVIEKIKFDNNLEPVVNYINYIISEVLNDIDGNEKLNEFIENNKFDLPVVIIIELSEDNMALLFADINANATKLDSNLETWIYGNKDINKRERKIFVQIGEKLNSNPNSPLFGRFKMPTNFDKNNLSKIGIKPFCDNSLKLLNTNKKRKNYKYNEKPFNLLFDKLTKYETNFSDESIDFMINGLLIVYFVIFHNAKKLYGLERWESIKHGFINTNNLGLYLYIIRYITIKLHSKYSENFLELFYSDETIKKINEIFTSDINESLENTYKNYNYFEKGKMGGSGGAKEAEVVKFFKKKLYINNEDSNGKDFNKLILEKKIEDLDGKDFNKLILEMEIKILNGN